MNLLLKQLERKFICKSLSSYSYYLSCLSKLNCSTTNDPNLNGYQLNLYNHYTRDKELVEVAGSPVILGFNFKQSSNKSLVGTAYVCGPTVYDYCHIGHAMAYTRFDIFRRFLNVYSNVNLVTAMGITDIDEKILTRSKEEGLSYKAIGDKYFAAFLEDLKTLNIIPVDIFVRITDHIDEIIDFIACLESKGHAYISSETGDINFDTASVKDFDVKADIITTKSTGKKSPKDFALWRSASTEPLWIYRSPLNGRELPGRPGWHVECSVIASWLFGSSLDFHFGGKDLIYPHHFCESACSSAYFDLVDKQPAIKWASHWFHSSHIRLSKEKMSKSLGNVIFIKDFVEKYNANILRIMCAYQHYRFDFEYDSLIIKRYSELDRIFKQFTLSIKEKLLTLGLYRFQNDKFLNCEPDDGTLFKLINESNHEIIAGAADDWDLHRGLLSILDIIKYFDNLDNPSLIDLYCIKKHVFQWMCALGLNYPIDDTPNSIKQDLLLLQLINYRKNVRDISLRGLGTSNLTVDTAKQNFTKILKASDEVREKIESLGYVIKDSKFKPD